jgi:hypothetical protein
LCLSDPPALLVICDHLSPEAPGSDQSLPWPPLPGGTSSLICSTLHPLATFKLFFSLMAGVLLAQAIAQPTSCILTSPTSPKNAVAPGGPHQHDQGISQSGHGQTLQDALLSSEFSGSALHIYGLILLQSVSTTSLQLILG